MKATKNMHKRSKTGKNLNIPCDLKKSDIFKENKLRYPISAKRVKEIPLIIKTDRSSVRGPSMFDIEKILVTSAHIPKNVTNSDKELINLQTIAAFAARHSIGGNIKPSPSTKININNNHGIQRGNSHHVIQTTREVTTTYAQISDSNAYNSNTGNF